MKSDQLNYWALVVFMILAAVLCSHTSFAEEDWERVLNLEGKWKFSIGDKMAWADTYFNDQKWEDIYVPSNWEDEGFNGYNGYAWYRNTFDGAALTNKELIYSLSLGYIDDVDEVYLNGHKIGSSGSFPPRYHTAYNARRNYIIPNEYMNFNGRNVIAVRVYDSEIEGGIVSGDIGIYTSRDDRGLAINLRGMWNFKLAAKLHDPVDEKYFASMGLSGTKGGWSEINVPDIWEHQGFGNYDGSAWYHKTFIIPKQMAGEDLVLVLGKIDDSDKTYLNGKLIGSTQDQHDKLRIYHISPNQFKAGEANVLYIYVEDPQGYGGIYEGPVGMMKQVDFTKFMRWR